MTQKNILSFSLLFFISVFSLYSKGYAEPTNLSLARQEVVQYYANGSYAAELNSVVAKAESYIHKRAAEAGAKPQKLAIVLDIDETSLSNVSRIIRENFSADPVKIKAGILAADSPAIKPMLALFNHAKRQGVAVFFVTGREQSLLAATEKNLMRAGYTGWAGLYFRPEIYKKHSIVPFKSHARASIARQGYIIIASIGDQESDLLGGYAEKGFKLPNPFYYLP